jgi:hypothetical protein
MTSLPKKIDGRQPITETRIVVTPKEFAEQNKVLTKPQGMTDEECRSLPVYSDGVQCVSCWEMTWSERLAALITGRVWLQIYAGRTQPPVALTVGRTIFKADG